MTALATHPADPDQRAALPSEIISVHALLADPQLVIPQYQRPCKWTGKHVHPFRRHRHSQGQVL